MSIISDDMDQSLYCPTVWDGFLCWPRTQSGEDISLSCPVGENGLDPKSKFFFTIFLLDPSSNMLTSYIYIYIYI